MPNGMDEPHDAAGGAAAGETTEALNAGVAGRGVERTAVALLGAASGGVLGLLAAGFLARLRHSGQDMSIAVTAGLSVLLAAGMAAVNLRQKPAPLPVAPRIAWGTLLAAAALLLTLAVFLFQGAYVQGVASSGGQIHLPLPIWPISRAALLASLALVLAGVLAGLAGLGQLSAQRGRYSGGKWVAMSVLLGAAWAGLGLACYIMACGITFLR
ncbi:MAG TPA: hypothetical protein VEU62_17430 [Bryobacterales bacterium]|nr:hypothetical protein [Bryobacterales bacterium]